MMGARLDRHSSAGRLLALQQRQEHHERDEPGHCPQRPFGRLSDHALQLTAPARAEEKLLTIALAVERVLGTRADRLGTPPLLAA